MIIDELQRANIEALKNKDKVARAVLSVVINKYRVTAIELKAQGKEVGKSLVDDEKLDYCKYFCGNSIHKKCFEMWKKTKKEPVCVYCRGNWNGEKKRFKRRGRYINLQRDGLEHQGEEELEYDDLGDFIVEDDNYMDYLEDENYLI